MEPKFVKTKPLIGQNVSDNTSDAKLWLDKVSPSICLAKWFHVSLHLTNGRTHSCYHPPTHKIDINKISLNPKALHNTDQKKEERKMMLKGEPPKGCTYCWNIEDTTQNQHSDRHYRSGEHWASPYREYTRQLNWDHDFDPTYVEVNFNQACNFKCSYCSPHLSTEWQKEVEKFGPYPTSSPHNDILSLSKMELMPRTEPNTQNPFVQAFWKWWPEMYENLHMFRMTGGEPLMDVNTFKVLNYVSENPKGDLEISITSNLCPPDASLMDKLLSALQKIQDYKFEVFILAKSEGRVALSQDQWPRYVIDKDKHNIDSLKRFSLLDVPSIERSKVESFYNFKTKEKIVKNDDFHVYSLIDTKACKHFSLFVSLDAWEKKAEYIRHGMKFDLLLYNVKRVLFETHFTTITFINTFNLMSITSFVDFLGGILNLRKYVNDLQHVEGKNEQFNNYWSRQRVWFDVPLLRFPAWQSVQNLPEEYLQHMDEAIRFMELNHVSKLGELLGFSDFEIEKVKRNKIWMSLGKNLDIRDLNQRRKDFFRFFSEHDRRRETAFENTFPEMKDFWRLCKDKETYE
jgi:hypothetical protein